MFSGIGGFELGIERAFKDRCVQQEDTGTGPVPVRPMPQQCTCVGYSEIDNYAISVYEKHYGGHHNYGDCTKINYKEVPDFNLLVGGSPCQDLSIAGKQKGLSGTRSGLFFQYVRCLKEKQPDYFIWENVKGALSSSLGWDFARVQIEFTEAGYDCQWLVFNSKDFGVPQNRERIFVVGTRTGRFREVLPFRRGDEKTTGNYAYAIGANYSKGHPDPVGSHQRTMVLQQLNETDHQSDRVYSQEGLAPTLPAKAKGNTGANTPLIQLNQDVPDAQRVYDVEGSAKTLKGLGGGMGAKTGLYAIPCLTPDREEKRQEGRRFKEPDDPAFTLNGQDRNGVAIPIVHNLQPRSADRPSLQKNPSAGGHGHLTKQDNTTYCLDATCTQAVQLAYRIRRLTPTECMRLQGFPDDWCSSAGLSDTQQYKCAGNAVTVNVIEAIITGMLDVGCFQ